MAGLGSCCLVTALIFGDLCLCYTEELLRRQLSPTGTDELYVDHNEDENLESCFDSVMRLGFSRGRDTKVAEKCAIRTGFEKPPQQYSTTRRAIRKEYRGVYWLADVPIISFSRRMGSDTEEKTIQPQCRPISGLWTVP